jgi:nucleoside-diphosphate-sugar epimerase
VKGNSEVSIERGIAHDDPIVIAGAGGFIAGALTRYFHDLGYRRIRAIDRKPLPEWYQRVPGAECLSMDLSEKHNTVQAVKGAAEVYNLAADMGGMGFIERFRVECLRSILINTHLVEAAWRAGAQRYVRALKESDAHPAMAERGYGWEKLISEMFCQEYWAERRLETHIARFHNIYGPYGTWFGGREKAPAALSRKAIVDYALRPAHCHAGQPWVKRVDLDRRSGNNGGRDRRREAPAHLRPECPQRRRRTQQR